ncbi:hypothetical protein [Catellatospora tritici]|uniref:hypothetical protein n=1 Tax=Catellatospora tritici TaxID=2851566 RepID=UPI001C2CCF6A|nr:hypothetical protein [Catellatospora tritici]MBV1853555.1 hypothetical protein [Catellatospora tritici]
MVDTTGAATSAASTASSTVATQAAKSSAPTGHGSGDHASVAAMLTAIAALGVCVVIERQFVKAAMSAALAVANPDGIQTAAQDWNALTLTVRQASNAVSQARAATDRRWIGADQAAFAAAVERLNAEVNRLGEVAAGMSDLLKQADSAFAELYEIVLTISLISLAALLLLTALQATPLAPIARAAITIIGATVPPIVVSLVDSTGTALTQIGQAMTTLTGAPQQSDAVGRAISTGVREGSAAAANYQDKKADDKKAPVPATGTTPAKS